MKQANNSKAMTGRSAAASEARRTSQYIASTAQIVVNNALAACDGNARVAIEYLCEDAPSNLLPALTLKSARIEHAQVSAKGVLVRIVTQLRDGRKLVVRS